MIQRFKAQLGKKVRVRARGLTYEGTLKLITETDAQLRGDFKVWSIPLESIQTIEDLDSAATRTSALSPSIWKDSAD